VLTLSNVTVTLGTTAALRQASVVLEAGKLTAILGPNGAGKSTLLKTAAGLLTPNVGHVNLNGAAMAALPLRARAKAISYLAQSRELGWNISVRRLVALGRLPHADRGPDADGAAIARAMAAADVAHLADRLALTLSGGERARALLARALAVEPAVLLADEPIANLDPRYQLETMALLRTCATRGLAVAVVLHDLALAARFCDAAVLLHTGDVIAQGPTAEVMTPERIGQAFGVLWDGTRASLGE
jgi:iron complex transport system ATP-binding protein